MSKHRRNQKKYRNWHKKRYSIANYAVTCVGCNTFTKEWFYVKGTSEEVPPVKALLFLLQFCRRKRCHALRTKLSVCIPAVVIQFAYETKHQ